MKMKFVDSVMEVEDVLVEVPVATVVAVPVETVLELPVATVVKLPVEAVLLEPVTTVVGVPEDTTTSTKKQEQAQSPGPVKGSGTPYLDRAEGRWWDAMLNQ